MDKAILIVIIEIENDEENPRDSENMEDKKENTTKNNPKDLLNPNLGNEERLEENIETENVHNEVKVHKDEIKKENKTTEDLADLLDLDFNNKETLTNIETKELPISENIVINEEPDINTKEDPHKNEFTKNKFGKKTKEDDSNLKTLKKPSQTKKKEIKVTKEKITDKPIKTNSPINDNVHQKPLNDKLQLLKDKDDLHDKKLELNMKQPEYTEDFKLDDLEHTITLHNNLISFCNKTDPSKAESLKIEFDQNVNMIKEEFKTPKFNTSPDDVKNINMQKARKKIIDDTFSKMIEQIPDKDAAEVLIRIHEEYASIINALLALSSNANTQNLKQNFESEKQKLMNQIKILETENKKYSNTFIKKPKNSEVIGKLKKPHQSSGQNTVR